VPQQYKTRKIARIHVELMGHALHDTSPQTNAHHPVHSSSPVAKAAKVKRDVEPPAEQQQALVLVVSEEGHQLSTNQSKQRCVEGQAIVVEREASSPSPNSSRCPVHNLYFPAAQILLLPVLH
jgi:hypothetical protein